MLSWQFVHHLCDIASLGGVSNKPSHQDQALLRLSHLDRLIPLQAPAHDLTDSWRAK